MELKDKVVIVTGAASGIGKATAEAMARLGAHVAVVDVNEAGAKAVAENIGGLAVGCDLGDEQAVNDMVATVQRELGEVDVLFNNAGVATGGDPLSTDIDVWQSQWQINVMVFSTIGATEAIGIIREILRHVLMRSRTTL